ncbi:uncharacterized protein [Cardiocondyla obscurior]|uniref:uncharacterized protein n=1 Tax=Cardiocondyla obscurior TaxID=286306 RepID=UPI0039657E47
MSTLIFFLCYSHRQNTSTPLKLQIDNEGEDEYRTAREEAGHSDKRSDVLRGGGGLGKASYITGATPAIDADASAVVNDRVVTVVLTIIRTVAGSSVVSGVPYSIFGRNLLTRLYSKRECRRWNARK